jgi:NRAMP (natural resistance-associated macrophage protein)-like metal ion transporter
MITTQKPRRSKKNVLHLLGPGLITGASDNDPSGIATYSQAGAQFGYGMLWTMLFSYPFMSGIQDISARLGRVTGHGIAGNLRRYYPKWVTYPIVGLMVIANVINLGADIGAMGAALKLLESGSALLYAALFAFIMLVLQITVPYSRYASILKWLTLSLFTYIFTVFAVHVSWGEALRSTVMPSLTFNKAFLTTLIAVLGTTISPYLFFWQASQEVEEIETKDEEKPLKRAPEQARKQLQRIRLDTYLGMGFSNIVAFFIMLTAAATLNAHGQTDVQSANQAAEALRPAAGSFAFVLFSAGIIGTGLLSVPVLAGSAAYAVGEALELPTGLEQHPLRAKGFYAILAAAILIGLGINFAPIDPIKALYWSAVINGVIAPPIMLLMMLMATSPRIMREFTISKRLRIAGWLATLIMTLAAAGLLLTWGS